MSRDDSVLYTGQTSASFGSRPQPLRSDKRDEKIEKRTKLLPAAEIINEVIASEKRLVTEQLIRLPIDMKTTDEDVKSTLLAVQMNLAFIDRIHNKINNIMREQPSKPRKVTKLPEGADDE